jgi:hypothetical protein
MKIRLAALFLISCASALAAFSKKDAFAAIEAIQKDPWSNEATDAFQRLPDILNDLKIDQMMMSQSVIPWAFEKGPASDNQKVASLIFLRVYLAANLRSQLLASKPVDDPYSGWLAVISIYKRVKAEQKISFASIERLAALEAEGELKKFAERMLKENN